ncbi:hypothetical protein ACVXHB_17300 [Escherichia coli]
MTLPAPKPAVAGSKSWQSFRLVRPSTTRCRLQLSAEACPRYLGRVVKGINVKAPTPLWMKENCVVADSFYPCSC